MVNCDEHPRASKAPLITYISDHDCCERTEEDRVAVHEGQEALRAREDLPGAERPSADERTENLTPPNIEILRKCRVSVAVKHVPQVAY